MKNKTKKSLYADMEARVSELRTKAAKAWDAAKMKEVEWSDIEGETEKLILEARMAASIAASIAEVVEVLALEAEAELVKAKLEVDCEE